MKFRLFAVLLAISFLLSGCSNNNPATSTSSGTGTLYLATQGNALLQGYTITLSSGALTPAGSALTTGTFPFALALSPSFNALFADNNGSNTISAYTVNSDGSLTAASGTTATKSLPMGMAIDPAGKFLFVANQGSNSISAFSINGTALTAVAGSPFCTIQQATSPDCTPPAGISPTGPTAVVVSATGKFLYASNSISGTVSAFSISSTGVLAQLGQSPYTVGLSPAGMGIAGGGAFLYVTNNGSNDVSAFEICDKVVNSCATPSTPDGTLTPITGSPFSAGLGPIAVAADPSFNFVYVLDKGSFQISEYSLNPGSGVLSPLSPPAVSTGTSPTSFVIISGTTGSGVGTVVTNPTDFVFVANNGASTLSVFTLSTATGVLAPLGQAVTTNGNPTAVAAN